MRWSLSLRIRLILGIIMMMISAVLLIKKISLAEYNENKMESLAQRVNETEYESSQQYQVPDVVVDETEYFEDIPSEKTIALQALKSENQDLAGWIQIEGTQINYPVMQTLDEPEFYLHRDFDKNYSEYGTPFIDSRCSFQEGTSLNTIIYGHHMKNGSMFADLENYSDPDFAKENSVIRLDTMISSDNYEILAAFKMNANQVEDAIYDLMLADTEEKYNSFLSFVRDNAFYDTGVETVYGDQLVTLVTCEYSLRDGRFFLIAKKCKD